MKLHSSSKDIFKKGWLIFEKKMKSLGEFCLILLIALELNNMIKSCLATSKIKTRLSASKMQPVLSHWQVTILNSMTDSTLVVHCKSKDNDMGEHVINAGGNYN